MSYRRFSLALFTTILMFTVACGEDEVGGEVSDLCPGDECVECDQHTDCSGNTYCHEQEEVCVQVSCDGDDDCDQEGTRCLVDEGTCIPAEVCGPGEGHCDGDSVVLCNDDGTGYLEPKSCPAGSCEEGQCSCTDEGDCGTGETCSGGVCECPSSTRCGDDGICCGEGEICAETEVCDEDGNCEQFRECRPECPGEVCGFQGELCCEGDNPVCGPDGECAPSCEGEGELCGEDFDECCPSGQVCIFGDCVAPGAECEHFTDCDFGEYCDQALGQCLPDDFPDDLVCEEEYDFGDVQPGILWEWDGVDIGGDIHDNVMMTPVVADMNGDGTPDVVVNAYSGGSNSYPVVINGETGETIYHNATHGTDFGSQLVAADVTGGDLPEIVAVEDGGQAIGVIENIVDCPDPTADDDGCFLWWNSDDVNTGQPAPTVADLNADGDVEIMLGDAILEAETGSLIASLDAGGYTYTTAVDVTGDGRLEVLGAGCLYSLDDEDELSEEWCNEGDLPGGGRRFVAVGDLTDDGAPEFVITGTGTVYIVDAETGELLYDFALPGGGNGGSPIVADFDGDDTSEVGVAGGACYSVFDLDCLAPDAEGPEDIMTDKPGCERPEIETCEYGHHCACSALEETQGTGDGVLWSIYSQDASSHRTGSSVFDFNGDGRKEVVYNDECLLMVLDGKTGSPYFLHGNTNRTSSEYPLIVDVTGNDQTNIVVSGNNDQFDRDCEDPIANQPERFPECHPDEGEPPDWCSEGNSGVLALQDPDDRWVRTRSVWNQFDYHIDNATDDASVPISPNQPWESHNTFRANRQGEIPLNAPDVVVDSIQVNAVECPPEIAFQATIKNEGVAAIPAGMPVTLYRLESGASDGELLVTETLDDPISPGGIAQIEFVYEVEFDDINQEIDFQVVANDDGSDGAPVRDCNPDDAAALVEDVMCQYEL